MSIESYGGNPDIVATREEIERTAYQIKLCAEELGAWPPLEILLTDPLHQLQFRIASIGIHQKLERLYGNCLLASESYFTTEAQIHRRFELTFIPELANLALGLTQATGWKLDTGVKAELARSTTATKPTTITNVLDRLWEVSSRDKPTVAIDSYLQSDGSNLAIVYVPGTQVLGDDVNPLDMASNIQAMAGSGNAASEKAVLLAIEQAGIKQTDELIFVGHSQGGMVAGNLATHSVGFLAAGLITFGAPIAHLKNLKAPTMAIEHVNDPVPNISGKANPNRSNWVTVQRISEKPESNALMFSHSLKSYKNTTLEIDSSSDAGIKNIKSKLLQKIASAQRAKSLEFVISRESR